MTKLLQWLAVAGLVCLSQAEPIREGRLLDTTTVSTVTLTTASYCYTTAAAVSACTRKKRALIDDKPIDFEDLDEFHSILGSKPSAVSEEVVSSDLNEVASSDALPSESDVVANSRRGRNFYYLYTTTSYSSSYTYSTTTTITFSCTPSTSVFSLCG